MKATADWFVYRYSKKKASQDTNIGVVLLSKHQFGSIQE